MKYIILSLFLSSLATAQTSTPTPQQKIETPPVKQEQVAPADSQGEENPFEIGPYVNGEYEYFNRLKLEQEAAENPEAQPEQI